MKTKFLLLIMIISLSVSSSGQTEDLMYGKLERPNGITFYNMPVGLCEDYPEETTTMEIIRNDFEFLKKHDVKFMRISFGWDAIESTEGKYDWLFWDDFVKMAVDEYGITLLPYICYVPQWSSTNPQDTMFFWNYPPKDNKPWGDFIKALVNKYKDRIKTWELWNEPDIWIYWQGSRKQFVDFMRVGAEAVREADPSAKIVFPGIAYDPEFVKDLFKNWGMSKYFDIINMHNYYETWHRHPIEEITNYVNEVYDVVWRYGNNQPLWMAEVGYSTFRKGARVSDSYNAYFEYEHSPEYQAIHLFKTLALVASTEKISAVAWYEIKDLPPSENVIGDNDNNRYLGVAYPDHKPKQSANALQFFNKLFNKRYCNANDKIKVDRPVGSETVVNAFENEDGSFIVTTWIQTTVPGRNGNDKSGMVKDTRKETISIQLLSNLSGDVKLYDELGNKKEFSSVEKKADALFLKGINLEGGKIAVFEIK
jgi:Beta-galactosidase